MEPIQRLKTRVLQLQKLLYSARARGVLKTTTNDVVAENIEMEASVSEAIITETEETITTSASPIQKLPNLVFFEKDGKRADAFVGNFSPFYAYVDEEYMGYNRLLLLGWQLKGDDGSIINSYADAWDLNRAMLEKARQEHAKTVQAEHPNAFAPWTEAEDTRLINLYSNDGKNVTEIADIMGRTKNGISLRLRRLLNLKRLPYRKKEKDTREFSLNPLTVTTIDPADVPDNKMPEYLNAAARIEEWTTALRNYALKQAGEYGVSYEGYEIKTSEQYSFSDPKTVYATIKQKYPDLWESCVQLKTITAVRKALGEERYIETVEPLIDKKEKKTLVKSKETEQ